MSNTQQLLTMDEIAGAEVGQMWLEAIVAKLGLKPRQPNTEITVESVRDTTITTLWVKQQPVAIVIRQRNDWNWTATTMVEITPMKAELPTSEVMARRPDVAEAKKDVQVVGWTAFCPATGGRIFGAIRSMLVARAERLYPPNDYQIEPIYVVRAEPGHG